VFSLNVPLPGAVRQRVESLRPALGGFETVREVPTLVAKRFGRRSAADWACVESEARLALAGAPAFAVRLDGLDAFDPPVSGPGPVVYLTVESPGLAALHERLVEAFGAVAGLEGPDYVPHVTVARGGGPGDLEPLLDTPVEPVEWDVTELWFWDARHGERVGRVGLPG